MEGKYKNESFMYSVPTITNTTRTSESLELGLGSQKPMEPYKKAVMWIIENSSLFFPHNGFLLEWVRSGAGIGGGCSDILIGHFRVPFCLRFKASLSAKPLLRK